MWRQEGDKMAELDKIRTFLMQFPLWGDMPLEIDRSGAVPGHPGLFPQGVTEYGRKEDILGGVTVSCRSRYLLLLRLPCREEENARWLRELADWVRQSSAMGLAPVLGVGNTRLRCTDGKLKSREQAGTVLYQAELTAEFDKIYKGE